MTLEIAFLFALLIGMVVLFLTEKLPVDLTAFLGLVILIFGGYLSPSQAFTGFSSPAVITMMSVFIVGAALLETGVAHFIGGRIHAIVGNSETRLMVTLMLVAGVMSAFMNNIAATAVLMPAVATLGPRTGLAPSRLFMPLAFGAILGGTTTLVGTPPNILAAQVLADRGLEPFTLFDFTPIGICLLLLGTVYMITIGKRLLPAREQHGPKLDGGGDLSQVYQLRERLFSIRIPRHSPLHGRTLAETRLGNALGVKVLSIVHEGREQLAPDGKALIRQGSVLMVDGSANDVREILRLQGVEVQTAEVDELPALSGGVGGVRFKIAAGSPLLGRNLREIGFRERFGVVVVGIRHGDILQQSHLAQHVLHPDDTVLALGTRQQLEALAASEDFAAEDFGLTALEELRDQVFWIRIPEDSPLVGLSMGQSRLGELIGLTVAGLIRASETRLAIQPDETLLAGDRLLIVGNSADLQTLLELGDVRLDDADTASSTLESDDVGMVEVALSPRSSAAGRTMAELDFRDRYGMFAVALWREGKTVHSDLAHLELRFGDALLLQGPREKIQKLANDADFVVLAEADPSSRRTRKAPYAVGCLALMIGLVASGYQPIHVAAFTAASLVILAGALTMREAYQVIEWRAIFLVAAVLPVGLAIEQTGAALLIAESVASVAGPLGPYAVLAALVFLASMLSQGLDGAPAVVLLAPVVLQTAENLGYSPYPFMRGVSLAASAAFMTPFSHKANLLVMGAGGYKSSDYLKVGTPLTVLVFIVLVILVPVFFPFH